MRRWWPSSVFRASTAAPKFGYPLCNYTSEINSGRLKGDTDARMFGGEYKIRPYVRRIVRANLVFALIVTARVISGVASHIQVEETEALHVSRIALMVRGYLRSECVKE
ncbi:MAG: hypothetical protein BECKG1743E_GA0114224_110442, partial [Candidatus Kentron sp. G]